jgi:hypothetical protein
MYNSFYLHEKSQKRSNAIVFKLNESRVNLTKSKIEKEAMHSNNIQDSFRATLRSWLQALI